MKVLVTGGAGYIGSHTCLRLIEMGHTVTVFDNFSNSSPESIRRVETLTGMRIHVVVGDVRDVGAIKVAIEESGSESVVHLAGLKSVSESVREPSVYYDVNVLGTLNVATAATESRIDQVVFSSSATVYGDHHAVRVNEMSATNPSSPYGRSKLFAEGILKDISREGDGFALALLRYFNPVGAHESGMIGEEPAGVPANLMPYVAKVASGQYPELLVFGDDYGTPDGTGVRDYIHVVDLADAHVEALHFLEKQAQTVTWNVGRGSGVSVLEMVEAFRSVTGRRVPIRIVGRRDGDVATSCADVSLILKDTGWKARRGIDEMVLDLWRWQSSNPRGYGSPSSSADTE